MDIIETENIDITKDSIKFEIQNFTNDVLKFIESSEDSVKLSYCYWYLGDLSYLLKDYSKSITYLNNSINYKPVNISMIHEKKFKCYYSLNDLTKAEMSIDSAIYYDAKNELYYIEKLDFYLNNFGLKKARLFCYETLTKNNNFYDLASFYLNFFYQKKQQEIYKEAKEILKINKRILSCYYYLVIMDYYNSKNTIRTKRNFNKLKKLDKNRVYINQLGNVFN